MRGLRASEMASERVRAGRLRRLRGEEVETAVEAGEAAGLLVAKALLKARAPPLDTALSALGSPPGSTFGRALGSEAAAAEKESVGESMTGCAQSLRQALVAGGYKK